MIDHHKLFDAIIIGGSYAGLSAALSLGRSVRDTLVIDAGEPCNRFSAHSHNFLTQDGRTPLEIFEKGRTDVLNYPSVSWLSDGVTQVDQVDYGFKLTTDGGLIREAKKLILATGITDHLPTVTGLDACWGKTIVHCPYCHGYEFREKRTAILGGGDKAFHLATLLHHLTPNLIILDDGLQTFNKEQMQQLADKNILVFRGNLIRIEHENGALRQLVLDSAQKLDAEALYVAPAFTQNFLVQDMKCKLKDSGHIEVDQFQQTSIPGVFACGDNSNMMRSVAGAVASGNLTGAMVNMQLAQEEI